MKLLLSGVGGLVGVGAVLVLASCSQQSQSDDFSTDAGADAPSARDGNVARSSTGVSSGASTGLTGASAASTGATSAATGATSGSDTTHAAGNDTTGATSSGSVASVAGGGIVINEISGKDTDYVELFNTGTAAIALDGWGITDAKDNDAGVPGKVKGAAVFASGTMLAPGGYALALGAPKDGGIVLSCPSGVQCVQTTWNISNAHGAMIYVLNPAGSTVLSQAFPAETTESGQSWGRLPNGTGTFQLNDATPGTVNEGT